MGIKEHRYQLTVIWTGNKGSGTSDYRLYEREHVVSANGKPDIFCSSDPAFRGDQTKYNPEELLVAALSSCHMLWFLHLCANSGVVVTGYVDNPTGIMTETETGSGKFKEVTLNPVVTVSHPTMLDKLNELHRKAHELCFIANSVSFPVYHAPIGKTMKPE